MDKNSSEKLAKRIFSSHKQYYMILCFYILITELNNMVKKRTMSVNERDPPPRVSSMNHFLERGRNPNNFCCLGQSSIS
jgi:hypothetical protein